MNVRPPPAVDALDADGGIVRLRPIAPDDLEALITRHERCAASDLRYRFFGSGRGALAIEAGRLISLNETGEGAALPVEDEGRLLGAASFAPVPDHPDRAEFGVLVVPDHQHRGLGTLMLEHLASAAAAAWIRELSGQVLAVNLQMLRLAKRLVPGIATPYQGGVADLVVETDFDETLAEEVAERERASERISLRPLLDPASVAVVGASRSGKGIGARILRSIVDGGFTGPVYPIHPEASGRRTWSSLAEAPKPVDLVVVAVPAPAVAEVLREAGAAWVRGAVVISSGFAENAGGVGVVAADAAQAAGLEVQALSEHARRHIAQGVSREAATDNPVDLGAAAGREAFGEALAFLGASREVDAKLAVVAATGASDVEANLTAIARALDALPGLPAVVVLDASTDLGARRIPVFDFPETAVAALGRAAAYARWSTSPLGKRPQLQGIDRHRAHGIVERLLEDGNEWQTVAEAAAILKCYGIPLALTATVSSKSRAVAAARDLGYPVAVKADAPGLVHKSEAGAVRLDLRSPREVRAAFKQVAAIAKGDKRAAVVLQPMLETELELTAGIVHDPRFGSLVPEIAELDLNPLSNVNLRLARIGDEPDPIARRLR
ncbi:GNAT family N-acetyltransferase [Glycomyces luteolus]|uniref:GNAT family N-acetyltransferase n=1 Tax=Glycomyces luteolus TaxID=2670330 RepID=A0A9X3SS75_9ACTN|nr:GNAT family N-acetyltransferase [Glycomyces luteolus]MDA1360899.1 GNAT family N-acetyltransferase [Glycomyces luteolus]